MGGYRYICTHPPGPQGLSPLDEVLGVQADKCLGVQADKCICLCIHPYYETGVGIKKTEHKLPAFLMFLSSQSKSSHTYSHKLGSQLTSSSTSPTCRNFLFMLENRYITELWDPPQISCRQMSIQYQLKCDTNIWQKCTEISSKYPLNVFKIELEILI